MKIKLTTEYAIRMIVHMALHGGVISSEELSKKLDIPQSIILKIGGKLSKKGIVYSIRGVKGGVSLRKRTKDITLLEVISLFEPTIKISKCLEEDGFISRNESVDGPMRKLYFSMQEKVEEMLGKTTIQNLIEV